MFKKIGSLLDTRSPDKQLEQFYKDDFKKLNSRMGMLCLTMICFIVITCFIYFLTLNTSKVNSFLLKKSNKTNQVHIKQIRNYKRPFYSNEIIRDWSINAVENILKLNFYNPAQEIQNKKKYFANSAWPGFKRSFKSSGIYKDVTNSQLVVSSVVMKEPLIIMSKKYKGQHIWEVKLQASVFYKGAIGKNHSQNTSKKKVDMIISTVNPNQNYRGLGIVYINFSNKD